MPNTFELIASSTVTGATAASIDFTSIPQTYTDLVVKLSVRPNSADSIAIKFNNSTTGYSSKNLEGSGASASSGNSPSSGRYINYAVLTTASTFTSGEVYIPNYTSANYKSALADAVGEANATTAYADLNAILWSNTAAINQITLYFVSQSLVQYSTAYLYGVKNA
jgi:hypothetical protein